MEIAHWTHSWTAIVEDNADRVYIGHDTSFDGFPSACDLIATAKRLDDRGKLFSLVAPPLMENEMIRLRDCLDTLSNRVNAFEVVCNDWGLLEWLTQSKAATPVLGRFLTGQATDPRLAALDWPGVQIPHERLVPQLIHLQAAPLRQGMVWRGDHALPVPAQDDQFLVLSGGGKLNTI